MLACRTQNFAGFFTANVVYSCVLLFTLFLFVFWSSKCVYFLRFQKIKLLGIRWSCAHCSCVCRMFIGSIVLSNAGAVPDRRRSRRGRRRCHHSRTRPGALCPAPESAPAASPAESRVQPAVSPARTARARPNATPGTHSRRGRAPTTRSCTAATSCCGEAPLATTKKHLYIRHPPMRLCECPRVRATEGSVATLGRSPPKRALPVGGSTVVPVVVGGSTAVATRHRPVGDPFSGPGTRDGPARRRRSPNGRPVQQRAILPTARGLPYEMTSSS